MTVETSRTLGGVGALLMVLTPFFGTYTAVLGLIGLILVMVALKGLSDHYGEKGIFNNALYGVILAIVGIVVFIAMIVVAAIGFLSALGIDLSTVWSDPAVLSNINWQEILTLEAIWPHIATVLGSFILLFIFFVVAGIFSRRSLNLVSEKTGVGLFGTTGLLILIGAILTIIGIGFILLWIALILLTISFFSIKTWDSADHNQSANVK